MHRLLTRDQFREGVFDRDGNRCVLCGQATEDMMRWRRDYHALSDAIRRNKARLRTNRRFSNTAAAAADRMSLLVLSAQAAAMMEKRRSIKTILRCTAYAYAPKELVG